MTSIQVAREFSEVFLSFPFLFLQNEACLSAEGDNKSQWLLSAAGRAQTRSLNQRGEHCELLVEVQVIMSSVKEVNGEWLFAFSNNVRMEKRQIKSQSSRFETTTGATFHVE